jgi:hypothetical protein
MVWEQWEKPHFHEFSGQNKLKNPVKIKPCFRLPSGGFG